VVGSTGLVPDAWHWSWERNGGPQVNSRFEKHAGRRMTGQDWSAWISVKAIVQSVLRTRTTDWEANKAYLLSDNMNLDGAKGNPMSFRLWDGQMRQPMFLATSNAIIERTPIRGFLHQTNDLDTLGLDKPETECRR
jgi:ABC transporter substrate binding protein (PQQ-dependent alcohol dehydrogenase system)